MRVSVNFAEVQKVKWYEYLVRFAFGGAITAAAGLVAQYYGPTVGGLFLAFPAIFPATVTLVEKHQRQKRQKAGIPHSKIPAQAASIEAYGAAMGTVGLCCFAFIVLYYLPGHSSVVVLISATAAWCAVSSAVWRVRKDRQFPRVHR